MTEYFIDKNFNVFAVDTTTWSHLERTLDIYKYPKISQSSTSATLPTDQLAQYFINQIAANSIPQKRWLLINKLEQALKQLQQHGGDSAKRAQAIQEKLMQLLKQQDWKCALILLPAKPIFDCPTPALSSTIDASIPVQLSTASFIPLEHDKKVFAIMGNSFVTNKQDLLAARQRASLSHSRQRESLSHSMDVFYVKYVSDGVVFALADGCGGHNDPSQDQRILLSAKTSVQHACQLLAQQYSTAEELKANAHLLIKNISQMISSVVPVELAKLAESTTLLVGRVFQQSSDCSKLVAINIGDGMLAAVTPQLSTVEKLTFKTVAPACVTPMGTAMLPDGYKFPDVLVYEADCVPGTTLVLMSDGVHDYLPKMRIDTQNGHSLTYLDDQQIASHLRENGGLLTETCIHTLAKLSISRLNQARIESLQRSQEATKQLPQAQETMQVELAGIASEKQTNNESWEKVPAMPPEQQTDEKKRLGAIDKLLLRRQEQAQSSIEVLIKQQQFELGDDFTIVGIPVF